MQTIMRNTLKLTAVLLLVMALLGSGLSTVTSAAAAQCVPTVSFNLWAKTGTATLYGSTSVTIWGYTDSASGLASIPGPVLDVAEGTCVGVTLNNNLSENTSLLFQGQDMIPDTTGVAPGGSNTYIFTAAKPGTYLYEAGLIPGSQHQVALGLYGTLIVRPATAGQAYNNAASAFDNETVVVLSEYDSAVAANPSTFDMRKYAPKYFLINGKAYPGTAPIATTIGQKTLLRYVNAGLQSHAMSLLGFSQTVVATDGSPFTYPHKMVSETMAPGQTLDSIVSMSASVAAGSKFALYDANMLLRNNTGLTSNAGLGGMLTFLTANTAVSGGGSGGGPNDPVTTGVALSPNPANGLSDVTVTASVSDAANGGLNIQAAEFYIDNTSGTPTAMSATDLAFDSATESVTGTILAATLATMPAGNHTIYVRGQDSDGNWSSFASEVLNLDKSGPLLSSLNLTPNPNTGSVAVALSFTANDSTSGNSNVTAAEYWVDGNAVHTPITIGSPAPSVTLNATIASGLGTGSHVVSVRAQDALGNWSANGNITLVIDNVGPATSGLAVTPNPSNGAAGVTLSFNANDSTSGNNNVTAAEYWIDAGAHQPVTVASPAAVKTINVTIPAPGGLGSGTHVVHVRSQDSLGNWGAEAPTANLVVDTTGPSATSVTAAPNPNNGTLGLNTSVQAVRIYATFSDVSSGGSNLSNAEGFFNAAGTTGTGFIFIANDGNFNSPTESGYADIPLVVVATLANGPRPICVHAKDAAGNWGAINCASTLVIDKAAPTASGLVLNPTATNNSVVAVSAAATDAATGNSNIAAGEFFIDTAGAIGSGTAMTPAAASPSATISGNISAAVTGALTAGNHTVYVRARDAAGNWSPLITATLLIDRTAPTLSNVTVAPSPTNGAATVTATVTAADAGGSGLNGGQYWIDGTTTPPGVTTAFSGTSSPITISGINVSALSVGSHNLRVRVKDGAGNFSTVFTRSFNVTAAPFISGNLYFSTAGNTNPPSVGGTADDADIYFYNGTAFSRSIDVTTITNPIPAGANVDGYDRVDATHFYMSFDGSVTLPGLGTVQNEDVVFYNAGTWSVYFDGTPAARGLSSSDIDAVSIVGGTLYFSTSDTTVPAGVAGGGDDADIYSWNGTSFSRVYDASVLAWSTTNIDGFVRVDATHFYVSYSSDTTVPVLGSVQDEDVIYYNNGVWSVYFDGTSLGLNTSGNLDVDAFDLP